MSETMVDHNENSDFVRTSIEVDEHVWRKLRAHAVENGARVSEQLEQVLREYYDMEADTNANHT